MSDAQYDMIRKIDRKAKEQYPDLSGQISAAVAATLVDDTSGQIKGGVSDPKSNVIGKDVVDGLYANPETNKTWLGLNKPSWYL